jgi:hypothetical protein
MDFERPTRDNVEIGDLLVWMDKGIAFLFPITDTDKSGINVQVRGEGLEEYVGNKPYSEAVILKKDGRYLVGERVVGRYESSFKDFHPKQR